jgi:transposase
MFRALKLVYEIPAAARFTGFPSCPGIRESLTRYLDDGQIEIDNSGAERALRAVALGRKNFLLCGSDAGGRRAAAIYSLLGTAKLNGLDPELYLRRILENIADHPINRIHELLPWNFTTAHTDLA